MGFLGIGEAAASISPTPVLLANATEQAQHLTDFQTGILVLGIVFLIFAVYVFTLK